MWNLCIWIWLCTYVWLFYFVIWCGQDSRWFELPYYKLRGFYDRRSIHLLLFIFNLLLFLPQCSYMLYVWCLIIFFCYVIARAFCWVKIELSKWLSLSLYSRLKSVFALFLKDMKGGSVHKLRVKNFSLSLIILLCLTIIFWAWEKTHVLTPFLPPTDQFDVSSSMLSAGLPPCMLLVLLIFLSFLRFLAVSNFPFFLLLTFVHRAFC